MPLACQLEVGGLKMNGGGGISSLSVLRTFPHRFLKSIPQWVRRRDACKVECQASGCRGGNVGLSRLL
jgi:hypothetical protein